MKEKKKHKKLKPDDTCSSGNFQIKRWGNKVLLKNDLSKAEHNEFIKHLAEEYPKVVIEIDKYIEEIVAIIQGCNPLDLMLRAYWNLLLECFLKQTDSDKIAYDDNTAQRTLEYIQSVIVSIPPKPEIHNNQVSESDWARLTHLISTMYEYLIGKYPMHNSAYKKINDSNYEPEIDKFQAMAQIYWCSVRGHRHPIHDIPHLKTILSPHDEIFQELFSISVDSFATEVEKIQRSLFRGVTEAFEELSPYITKAFENNENELNIESEEEFTIVSELANKALSFDCFDLKKIANIPELLLNELSLEPGEEKNFLAPGEFSGWPLKVLPIHKKPFLKVGQSFYCFEYSSFSDNLYRSLQRIITKLKPEYAPNSSIHPNWKDNQTQITEYLPFQLLQSILPNSEIYRPIFYQYPPTNSNSKNWNECDGILIYDDTLFIIEVKGGAFTHSSPSIDFQSYITSVNNLLFSPWKQSKRFFEYLDTASEVSIYPAKNNQIPPLKTLKRSHFRQIIPCVITLDNLTQLASRFETLKPFGTDTAHHPTWAISIDDLRVYSDFFKSPLQFLHYLEERQKAYINPTFTVDDELFHLGMYIKHNQYSTLTEDFSSPIPPLFIGYSEDIDRYYNQLYIEPELAILPQQKLPENIEKIIRLLELQGKPGRSKVANNLLILGNKGREEISSAIDSILKRQVERGTYIKFSCGGKVKITLFTRILEHLPYIDLFRKQALADLWGNNEDERLLLELGYDNSLNLVDVSWEFLTKQDTLQHNTDILKELYELEEKKREASFLNISSKIGRNDPCPCGSKKKFKKCHGK